MSANMTERGARQLGLRRCGGNLLVLVVGIGVLILLSISQTQHDILWFGKIDEGITSYTKWGNASKEEFEISENYSSASDIELGKEGDSTSHRRLPQVLVLCTPAGGLTNIKQRLFDCLKSTTLEHADKDFRFLLPWFPVRPIIGPHVRMDTIFNRTTWLSWMTKHGYLFFDDLGLSNENKQQFNFLKDDVNAYIKFLSNWSQSANVSLVQKIGKLVAIDAEYGMHAFVVRDDLLKKAGVDASILSGCVIHARIEADWLKYSAGGPIFVPFDEILSAVAQSNLCHEKTLTILTGSESDIRGACPSCYLTNKTELNYIQAAAVDFHVGVYSSWFAGNLHSSLSQLIMLSKGYNITFTYSNLHGKVCIREVTPPLNLLDTNNGHGIMNGIVNEECIGHNDNIISPPTKYSYSSGEKTFLAAAKSFDPVTDKVTNHPYQIMYGQFLLPYYAQKNNLRMLEIGLGCNMRYGPGASVNVWKSLLPEAELWEGEYNAECVEKSKKESKLDGIQTLTGDQMDINTLDSWINQTGGANFDVVIDDGGHKNCQIWTTFHKLWPRLLPGGLYFIEDLHVSRMPSYSDVSSPLCKIETNVVDEVKGMLDTLVHRGQTDVRFIFCQRDGCLLGKQSSARINSDGEKVFFAAAKSFDPVTDKVTNHPYHIMYGQFLLPYYSEKNNLRMLEIGLGCNMRYGPGASVNVWKSLLPEAELWEGEYNAECVEKSKNEGKLDGIQTLTGDQMDINTLDSWINQTGGANFDIVIDDGGHKNCQIWTTFHKLWPRLLPGGLYFVEDLQVSRMPSYSDVSSPLCKIETNVVDEVKGMLDNLVHRGQTDVRFIFCQRDACVLAKTY